MNNKNIKYFKDDFLKSTQFYQYRDLMNTILLDNQKYSKEDVQNMLKKYFEEVI